MKNVLYIPMKIVKSIHVAKQRFCKVQFESSESYLLLHVDIRWLHHGNLLEMFQELLQEISRDP